MSSIIMQTIIGSDDRLPTPNGFDEAFADRPIPVGIKKGRSSIIGIKKGPKSVESFIMSQSTKKLPKGLSSPKSPRFSKSPRTQTSIQARILPKISHAPFWNFVHCTGLL